jgi:type VI secretion system protein VasD
MSSCRSFGAAVGCLALTLAGCAAKPPKPVDARAIVSASADVNPEDSGRPSPVVVRIYELRGDAEFNGADFFALFDKEKETLGASLILREERTMLPGQQVEFDLPVAQEARFVGAVAAFRDIRSTHWRAVVGAPEKSLFKPLAKNRVTIRVEKSAVNVSTHD